MKLIGKINIHSVVDVITNSSTTIYTYSEASSVDRAKELMQELMKVFGVTGDVDDYFEFCLYPSENWLDPHSDNAYDAGDNSKDEYGVFFDEFDSPEDIEKILSIEGVYKFESWEDSNHLVIFPKSMLEDLVFAGLIKPPTSSLKTGTSSVYTVEHEPEFDWELRIYAKKDFERTSDIAHKFLDLFINQMVMS